MAFDQKTRNLLQRTVTACRKVLDCEFTGQLQELYGIQPDGSLTPLTSLDHLGDEELDIARLLRERINHLEGGSATDAFTRTTAKPEHIGRVIREQAFTVLNRLAALRLCEERELVLECVRKGVNSEGFQLFTSSAGNALGETHEAYRVYLHCLFDELALDLGVLFARFSPLALLFPRHDALTEVLSELNGSGKAAEREEMPPEQFTEIWEADETIGWIYQYYNDEIERKKMREESSAPRSSRELAVRNQFFTPRYVVEFLTDNTLGRIWYEMAQGATKLKGHCRYLVSRPTEIFLQPGAVAPEQPKQDNLSQEDLLKQPVHIPHRPLKDPRTILMLDPACGSMHFGLYAFDLFEVIYDEAWALEEKLGADALSRPPGMKSLHDTFAGKDAFLKDVPRLIIEHNLHGIDIDPRCAQIAGLSLWLRAQKAWQRLGLKPADRPAIKRSNIVCAEPMPGEKELLREFVEREFPAAERAVCLRLLEAIFDKMRLAGEAGSLLKIEKEIRSAIEDARDAWQKLATKPQELFTTTELNEISTAPELTGLEQAVSSLTTEPQLLATDFWERIEERIYAALRDYAEQAENGGGFQRRLFAEDAARGFAFIDVCRKRYDVALMNPPFGEVTKHSRASLDLVYPTSTNELVGSFVSRALSLMCDGAFMGAITSRTCFFVTSAADWRAEHIYDKWSPSVIADLGHGVLDDAMVETAAYTLSRSRPNAESICIRLIGEKDKAKKLLDIVENQSGLESQGLYMRKGSSFAVIPGAPFAYWVDPDVLHLFVSLHRFETNGRETRGGSQSGDDGRRVRAWWEVAPANIGRHQRWVAFAKGGEFARYSSDIHLVVEWDEARGSFLGFLGRPGRENPRPTSAEYFFRPGLTWTGFTTLPLSVRIMPEGCVFAHVAPSSFHEDTAILFEMLAVKNSAMYRYLTDICMGLADGGRKVYGAGVDQSIPYPVIGPSGSKQLQALSRACFDIAQDIQRFIATDHFFLVPAILSSQCSSLRNSASDWSSHRKHRVRTLESNEHIIDELVFELYGIDKTSRLNIYEFLGEQSAIEVIGNVVQDDCIELVANLVDYCFGASFGRWDIRYATGEQPAPELPNPFAPLPVCPPGQLQNAQGLPVRAEEVPAAYPVRIPWDGVLVDDPNHPLDLERRVREIIEIIWKDRAESIEREACEILGVNSLRDYFRKPAGFFADHLKRYSKSRRQAPIYWPLSTASGSYTLWIYYHRLTPDTLYKCVQQFLNPKLADVEKELTHLRTVLAADEGGANERKRLEELEDLRRELKELRTEFELWAPKWKPNLNDGVLITAAPLWKFFCLPTWRKDLKACWLDLERGEYDWAHLAYTLCPDRVREKCKTDRSLAIAHGLEELCTVQAPMKKTRKAKKKATEATGEKEIDLGESSS